MQDALLQAVWRSPGGHTKASRVVAGRNIDHKMLNFNEFGQFKAQTSARVLLRPSILNLFTRVFCSMPVLSIRYCVAPLTRYDCLEPFFRFEERPCGVNLGILHPGGPGGGLAHARQKKQSTIWLAHDVAYLDRAQHEPIQLASCRSRVSVPVPLAC